jgi:transaldolase
MKMTKLHELAELGQAIWLDYISRSLIGSGELQELVDQGLRGVTSNPTILEKAIAGSTEYDEDLKRLVEEGKTVDEIYESLVIDEIRRAADILLPVHEQTNGLDGYVSLEVDPDLAHNTEATVGEARRLFATLKRPNVLIKVPATPAGIPAIETLIGEGVNVNVTLIFSLEQYEAVATAYIAGLEKLALSGGDVGKVASVASFFISRVDTAVDKALGEVGNTDIQGKIAIDNAKIAYSRFREIFSSERWKKLATETARVQRPLWASTSSKNPAYPHTLYVDNLIGPDTVNTLPPATLDDFLDHGTVATTVETDVDGARMRLAELAAFGIDLNAITRQILEDGVKSFARSFDALLASITEKRKKLLRDWQQPSASLGS